MICREIEKKRRSSGTGMLWVNENFIVQKDGNGEMLYPAPETEGEAIIETQITRASLFGNLSRGSAGRFGESNKEKKSGFVIWFCLTCSLNHRISELFLALSFVSSLCGVETLNFIPGDENNPLGSLPVMEKQVLDYWNRHFGGWASHFSGTKRKRLASLPESLNQSEFESAPAASAERTKARPSESSFQHHARSPNNLQLESGTIPQVLRSFRNTATQTSVHFQRSASPDRDQAVDTSRGSPFQSPASCHFPHNLNSFPVEAQDGVIKVMHDCRESSALLLTEIVSKRFRQFIEASRELEAVQRIHAEASREVRLGQIFITHHESMLEEESEENERNKLIQSLEERHPAVTRNIQRQEELEQVLEIKKKDLYWCQEDLRSSLEPSLIAAGLVEPLVAESNTMDWNNPESTEEVAGDAVPGDAVPDAAPLTDEETISEEELELRAARKELDDAAENLNTLRDEYEGQEAREREAIWRYKCDFAAGEATFPIEEMHQYLLQQSMDLVRALIEAEEQCDKAAARARALGLLGNTFDQESHFVDYQDDGESTIFDGSDNGEANREFIESWRTNLPKSPQETPEPDVDDWDAESINIGDSLSDVDYSRNRKRIDRWRFICEKCGENGDCGALGKEMIENGQ